LPHQLAVVHFQEFDERDPAYIVGQRQSLSVKGFDKQSIPVELELVRDLDGGVVVAYDYEYAILKLLIDSDGVRSVEKNRQSDGFMGPEREMPLPPQYDIGVPQKDIARGLRDRVHTLFSQIKQFAAHREIIAGPAAGKICNIMGLENGGEVRLLQNSNFWKITVEEPESGEFVNLRRYSDKKIVFERNVSAPRRLSPNPPGQSNGWEEMPTARVGRTSIYVAPDRTASQTYESLKLDESQHEDIKDGFVISGRQVGVAAGLIRMERALFKVIRKYENGKHAHSLSGRRGQPQPI
jgi:hypothetical protein